MPDNLQEQNETVVKSSDIPSGQFDLESLIDDNFEADAGDGYVDRPPSTEEAPPAEKPPQEQEQPQPTEQQQRQIDTTLVPQLERNNQMLQTRVQELEGKLNERTQYSEGVQQFANQVQQYGLQPQEAQVGLQLAAAWKANPAQMIQGLLRHAQSSGIKIDDAPNVGLDVNSIGSVIDQKLQPVLQRFQALDQYEQQQQQVQQEQQRFYSSYPEATVHKDVLGQIAQQYNLSLPDAYLHLARYANQHRLDLNQPLKPQVEARGNTGNGYSPGPRNLNTVGMSPSQSVDAEASWSEIVEQARRESGL